MKETALVTGASSGIGEKIAWALAARGFDLILVARRRDRLESLAAELASKHGAKVELFAADLASRASLAQLLSDLGSRPIDLLVNNAGAGWIGTFHDAPEDRQLEIIDLNCRALIATTRHVLPGMITRRRGRIIQVASVAGFMPGPRASVYYASKAFVVSHSDALRHELHGTGVTVTLVCPGPVATEFQRSSGVKGTMGGAVEMTDTEVAEQSVSAALRGQFLVVPGTANLVLVLLSRFIPRRISARLIDGIQKKRLASS